MKQLTEFFWKDKGPTLIIIQFVLFKPLSYYLKETIGFYVNASFAKCPASRLIKPGEITKYF